jgi:hypothetical protein
MLMVSASFEPGEGDSGNITVGGSDAAGHHRTSHRRDPFGHLMVGRQADLEVR